MDDERDHNAEENYATGKEVKGETTLLERRKEAGAYLHADGKDEQYKAELFKEMQYVGIHSHAEVTQKYAYKKNKRNAERYAEDFHFTELRSCGNRYRQNED
jgi:N-methylhydantoinase A/oxoprolinase/acetone carboxylase beta subunit